jgi:hypothetical protein
MLVVLLRRIESKLKFSGRPAITVVLINLKPKHFEDCVLM